MFDDPPCSLLVEAYILPRFRRSSLRNLDLLKILLHSSELFEDRMFFGLDAVKT